MIELVEVERLRAVAQRVLRVVVRLDDQAVRTGSDRGAGQRLARVILEKSK